MSHRQQIFPVDFCQAPCRHTSDVSTSRGGQARSREDLLKKYLLNILVLVANNDDEGALVLVAFCSRLGLPDRYVSEQGTFISQGLGWLCVLRYVYTSFFFRSSRFFEFAYSSVILIYLSLAPTLQVQR